MELENPSSMTASNSGSGEASISCFGQLQPTPLPLVVVKKKRNLAGIQVVYNGMRGGTDPEAEMVARSPKAFQEVRRAVRLESPSQAPPPMIHLLGGFDLGLTSHCIFMVLRFGFGRRKSFIPHRAFCDALAGER
ncbi:unnamed protein product, partial [Musa acuminata subsp. malaccensis]